MEAKEAGACGVLGVVSSVSGAGSSVLSSFSAAIGLDAPVEVCRLGFVRSARCRWAPWYQLLSIMRSVVTGTHIGRALCGAVKAADMRRSDF